MAYTITSGVHRETWQRFVRDSGLALPIIAVLFIIIAALSVSTHQSSGQSPYIPVKKQTSFSVTEPNSKTNQTKPSKNTPSDQSGNASSPAPAMSFGSLGSDSLPTMLPLPSTGVTGGLGGGDVVPNDTTEPSDGSTSGGDGGGNTTPTPTVTCTNLLTTEQVCTTCTPALTLQPGQKALLSADGTCVAAN